MCMRAHCAAQDLFEIRVAEPQCNNVRGDAREMQSGTIAMGCGRMMRRVQDARCKSLRIGRGNDVPQGWTCIEKKEAIWWICVCGQ